MTVNNFDIVSQFMPGQLKGPEEDGDQFLYTELMDRTKRVGNNGVRIVKTFFHRNLADFERHWPLVQSICDHMKVRAYTRLAPRSFRKVAHLHARLVLDALISENHAGVKTLYPSACGQVTPSQKLWMWDVDSLEDPAFPALEMFLKSYDNLLANIPSKRGVHLISRPFNMQLWDQAMRERGIILKEGGVSLHKDNATNLYIPDGAA